MNDRDQPSGGATLEVRTFIEQHADRLKNNGLLRSEHIERAFRRVARHRFIERFWIYGPDGYREFRNNPSDPSSECLPTIYSGQVLITQLRDGAVTSSSSESRLVAAMLELLEVRPGHRVLEIGTGSGYNAALLAEIVGSSGSVATLEYQHDVAEQAQRLLREAGYQAVHVLERDGFYGAAEWAPYDRIIVTAGSVEPAPAWMDQLSEGGFLLVPLRHAAANPLGRLSIAEGKTLHGRFVGFSGFMAIEGELASATYYPPLAAPVKDPVREEPLWPELRGQSVSWWSSPRAGFWFFLGLNDPRTRVIGWPDVFGLVDATGAGVTVGREAIVVHGDTSAADDLEQLYHEWVALQRPALTDYTVRFEPLPTRTPPSANPTSWTTHGRYYRRVVRLEPR